MDTVIKVAAVAALGTVTCLLIKRSNAEITAVLSIAVCAVVLYALAGLLKPLFSVIEKAKDMSGLSDAVFSPVLKCVAIGIVSKSAADMCRDGGQSAIAGTVELAGAVGAVFTAMPLLSTLLDMLEELA